MQRRHFLKHAVVSGLATALGPAILRAEKNKPQPNIIYFNVDDLGWTDTGFMGSRFYETPNIDRLAAEGVVFTNAYAPAANCAPSRACCLTGQYGPRHGIYTVGKSERGSAEYRKLIPVPNRTVLPDEAITIAEALKTGGYVTCHAGKWHLGDDPRTQGFDVNFGGSTYGLPRSYFSPYQNKYLPDGPEGEYLTDRLTSDVLTFLEQVRNRPFFLHFAFYSVHTPIQPKPEKAAPFKLKKGDLQHHHADYAGMIASVDENIGRVMQKLDELGLSENTLILFCSDNGGVFRITRQYPLRAGKGSYYEGGIREPMIVRWRGVAPAGRLCAVPVSGIDFYPTFLDAAGIPVPRGKVLDGLSLMSLIQQQGTQTERPLFWHFPVYLQAGNGETRDPLFRTRPGSAVRFGPWKLIEYFEDGAIELFNLESDIGEHHNLSDLVPEKARELNQLLRAWREDVKAPVPTRKNPAYNEAAEKQAINQFFFKKNKENEK
ncbi:sulfatase [candidate division KSB1 bacterium]|nr:sulfatase [candidate division KSB1 bacterium]